MKKAEMSILCLQMSILFTSTRNLKCVDNFLCTERKCQQAYFANISEQETNRTSESEGFGQIREFGSFSDEVRRHIL